MKTQARGRFTSFSAPFSLFCIVSQGAQSSIPCTKLLPEKGGPSLSFKPLWLLLFGETANIFWALIILSLSRALRNITLVQLKIHISYGKKKKTLPHTLISAVCHLNYGRNAFDFKTNSALFHYWWWHLDALQIHNHSSWPELHLLPRFLK